MQTIDFTRHMMHNSTKEIYRSPLGAVPAGTTVQLRIAMHHVYYKEVYLVVIEDGVEKNIPMTPDQGLLRADYKTPSRPQVVWYWFLIRLDENTNIYYGTHMGRTCGDGEISWNSPRAFQLTVYDPSFITPNWMKDGIMYQIFPDRFARSNDKTFERGVAYHRYKGRNIYVHESWDDPIIYTALEGKDYYEPCDYYGGTLLGIVSRLDELKELGISVIYLNPIAEASSNHRYNTGDYLKVDPILGTNKDFETLTREAAQRGIKIILDGVYSHTGDDSVYFNKYGRYDTVGAYQSTYSHYYSWYKFIDYPNTYVSWWGFDTLPEVIETDTNWENFIIEGEESVLATWLMRGGNGFRLDVADELPDATIEKMRRAIKRISQDNALIGEVWEDATTKQSYGNHRTYALGRGLDSVMNYPFTNSVVAFLNYQMDAYWMKAFFVGQSQNYPKEMYYALMNLLSSHDIERIRTVLGTKINAHDLSREQQAHFYISEEQDALGARLQKLAAVIQFTVPGMPCIYYGDEVGMHGLLDPFNRMPYHAEDEEMRKFYQKLAYLRANSTCLKTGGSCFYQCGNDGFGILRYCVDGKDAFENIAENRVCMTIINRSDTAQPMVFDLYSAEETLPPDVLKSFKEYDFCAAKCLLTDEELAVTNGLLEVEMPPQSARIYDIIWR